MDPIQGLVAAAMGILMPYVTKTAEEFTKAAGEVAFKKAKKLMDTLKARMVGDKEATDNLSNFEAKPERYKSVIEDVLREKLSQDKDFAAELEKLLEDMQPELDIIQKMKIGQDIVGLDADEMTKGKARITQEIDQAEKVTGAKIKRI